MRPTFSKTERLTSKKLINRLFDRSAQATGPDAVQSVYAHPFRVMYMLSKSVADSAPPDVPEPAESEVVNVPNSTAPQTLPQVLFSVPKRAFKKAVDRNLVRRRCREAYRLNKRILQQAARHPAAITFLYTAKTKISFEEIEKGMKLAMKRVMSGPPLITK